MKGTYTLLLTQEWVINWHIKYQKPFLLAAANAKNHIFYLVQTERPGRGSGLSDFPRTQSGVQCVLPEKLSR